RFAQPRVPELRRPASERPEAPGRKGGQRLADDRGPRRRRRVGGPGEGAVAAVGGREEARAQVGSGEGRSAAVEHVQAEEGSVVAEARRVDRGGELGGETGIEVG